MDKRAFWKLSWTWGFIMTLIGKIVFSVLQLLSYKPARNQYGYVIEIGEGWGGVSMGPYCLCEKNAMTISSNMSLDTPYKIAILALFRF